MTTIPHPVDAMAFTKPSLVQALQERINESLFLATSKSISFDLKANLPLNSLIEKSIVGNLAIEEPREKIHPADKDFADAARKAILKKFSEVAGTNTQLKASFQFRVITPKGRVRLVHQLLTPTKYGVSANQIVDILETDLSEIASNPIKEVRIHYANDEAQASILPLKGIGTRIEDCPFSERHLQILRFLAEGKTTAEISKLLFISSDTVRTHRQHILQRSEQVNMTATVVHCVRKGWL